MNVTHIWYYDVVSVCRVCIVDLLTTARVQEFMILC